MSAAPGEDSLENVFENDAKDIMPRLSPDQNDTAIITNKTVLFILQSWTKMSRKMKVAVSSFKIKFLK